MDNPEVNQNQPPTTPPNPPVNAPANEDSEPKAFKLYTGRASLLLQIVGGLMWLNALGLIFSGIPMLLMFGLGVIPIALGVLFIIYAKGIFKMQKKAYRPTLIIWGLTAAVALIMLVANGFQPVSWLGVAQFLVSVAALVAIYSYRNQFVNE